MPSSRLNQSFVWRIIRALLWPLLTAALVVGCSATRLGYGQLPNLSYWWVDSYLDLNDAQSVLLRTDLQALHSWHRSQELPQLARDLADVQAQAVADTTPAQVCQIAERFKARLEMALAQSEPALARLALSIQPEQLQHLQRQMDKRANKWRDEWLQGGPAKLQAQRLERLIDRSEDFYGSLTETQINLLRTRLQATPYDTALAEAEMLRRHQDLQQTLTNLAASPLTAAKAQEVIQALSDRTLQSPNTRYRTQVAQLAQNNCDTFALLHNSTTAQQRQKLIAKLKTYEDDARALIAQ